MTSRAAGRHRWRLSAQRTQSLLLLEYPGGEGPPWVYLNSGVVPNGRRLFSPGPASVNIRRGMGPGPVGGRRAIRTALVRDRRAFTLAVSAGLAGVAAAVVFGIISPLHSTWMTGSRPGTAGGLPPQASAPWSAAPLGSPSAQATQPSPAESATPSRPARRTRAATSPRAGGQAPAPSTSTGTTASTASHSSSGTAAPKPKLVVRYLVDSLWFGGFQGQVQIVNDGTQPIADWQIVIALPDDTVTGVQNAGGLVSHGILLLQPADADEVVPPGGTLNVFLAVAGTETIPAACAFNGIACN